MVTAAVASCEEADRRFSAATCSVLLRNPTKYRVGPSEAKNHSMSFPSFRIRSMLTVAGWLGEVHFCTWEQRVRHLSVIFFLKITQQVQLLPLSETVTTTTLVHPFSRRGARRNHFRSKRAQTHLRGLPNTAGSWVTSHLSSRVLCLHTQCQC